jgi:predicted DNA-binding transcriptional regulator AlpA
MRRLVDGPDTDLLSARQCAAWLGIGLTLFRELVTSGEFPAPIRLGRRKANRWHWLDAVAFAHLRSISRHASEPAGTTTRGTR